MEDQKSKSSRHSYIGCYRRKLRGGKRNETTMKECERAGFWLPPGSLHDCQMSSALTSLRKGCVNFSQKLLGWAQRIERLGEKPKAFSWWT